MCMPFVDLAFLVDFWGRWVDVFHFAALRIVFFHGIRKVKSKALTLYTQHILCIFCKTASCMAKRFDNWNG